MTTKSTPFPGEKMDQVEKDSLPSAASGPDWGGYHLMMEMKAIEDAQEMDSSLTLTMEEQERRKMPAPRPESWGDIAQRATKEDFEEAKTIHEENNAFSNSVIEGTKIKPKTTAHADRINWLRKERQVMRAHEEKKATKQEQHLSHKYSEVDSTDEDKQQAP